MNSRRPIRYCRWLLLALVLCQLVWAGSAHAQLTLAQPRTNDYNLSIGLNGIGQPNDVDGAIKVLAVMTILTLAPSIILLMTCFTRIVIVLSFVRSALSLQGTPSNQIIIGLSLFLTFFIMAPVWEQVDRDALTPYRAKQITSDVALDRADGPDPHFHAQANAAQGRGIVRGPGQDRPDSAGQTAAQVVIPSFIISELRTAFQMGFLLFVPFILIDLVVATVLMSMGMMMMPPMTISLPLKICCLCWWTAGTWSSAPSSRALPPDRFMNPEFATELLKNLMFQAVALAAPILLTALVLGLAISLFQSVTSIQEQTLTFVPKALGIVALLVILLPWILRTVMEFTTAVIQKMPQMTQ